ncbi:RNA-binding S4 domain-containing protein [Ferrovibrio xuzhouensis]|uniref:RNA-binding S4 domain-containing protein n=1 Tax=Ferrovibrio xuzhouensis TaxID=1576914 RepID=A0ABV7VGL2_9PROT
MTDSGPMAESAGSLRLDKWLWMVRICKSRALAQSLSGKRRIRINGRVVDKPHALVRPGDVLTLPLPAGVRVLRILSLPARRGPAPEARATYAEIPPGQPDS